MRQHPTLLLVAFVSVLFFSAIGATAQIPFLPVPALTVSTGYSNLQTERATNLFYTHDGSYIDVDAAVNLPLPVIFPIQAGLGATASGQWDRESFAIPSSNTTYVPYADLYSNVGFFELEPRLGIRIGGGGGFYVLPRIGAGLLVDSYAIDQSTTSGGVTYIDTQYHTGAAFEIRPDIQVGYKFGFISAGLETNYMWAWGDFGSLGRRAQEFRVGAFVKFSF
jgi:hypothetical protein